MVGRAVTTTAKRLVCVLQLKYTVLNKMEQIMASSSVVQARVDDAIRVRAGEVLGKMGLTVSDAVRILLTRIANEGSLPAGLTSDHVAHDAWIRAKIQEALDDPRPGIPNDEAKAIMAKVRSDALRKGAGEA